MYIITVSISGVYCRSWWITYHTVAASDGELPISPILGMVVGAALTCVSVVLIVVVKFRRSRSSGDQDDHQPHSEKLSGPNSTSLLHSASSGKDLGSSGARDGPGDEKDPDIIPAKFGEFIFTAENSVFNICRSFFHYSDNIIVNFHAILSSIRIWGFSWDSTTFTP